MHEYVQKSTTTTLPRNPSRDSGSEFSHFAAPSSGGIAPSTGNAPAGLRADIIAPPPAIIALLPDIIALLPDIAGPGSITSSSAGGPRSGMRRPNRACSSRVVLAVDTRDRNPVSRP